MELENPVVETSNEEFDKLIEDLVQARHDDELVLLGFKFQEWVITRFEKIGEKWYVEEDDKGNTIIAWDIGQGFCKVIGLIDKNAKIHSNFPEGEPLMIDPLLNYYHYN